MTTRYRFTLTDGRTLEAPAYKHHDDHGRDDESSNWIVWDRSAGWWALLHYRITAVDALDA